MTASNYRWVCTDRRTDADILKEIAQADTPVVIVSREEPGKYDTQTESSLLEAGRRGIYLLGFGSDHLDRYWQSLNEWSEKLSLLVMGLAHFSIIVDCSSPGVRKTTAERSSSLWDWLIHLQVDGQSVNFDFIEAIGDSYLTLSDFSYPRLIPRQSEISETFRRHINHLAGVKFRTNGPDVTALRAGLFQWHDALDESHECSQSIEGKGRQGAGDYWHAIMHRREPDYGNSKYWFRQVGRHPVFDELGRRAESLIAAAAPEWQDRLLKGGWDPFAFVDLCEAVADGQPAEWFALAETIQELEMLLLLDSTYRDAAKMNAP